VAILVGVDAEFAGRAMVHGVAASGKTSAKRALEILQEEIERDLGPSRNSVVRGVVAAPLVRQSYGSEPGTGIH
jgi:isopentenyl diphosphate isomerase/L-lactate dehydrogenase-like FMN-dependent dehydrogenase